MTPREESFDGQILTIVEGTEPRYNRTLLSKELLQGRDLPAPFHVRSPEWWRDHAVELRLGRRGAAATMLAPCSMLVQLADAAVAAKACANHTPLCD